MKYLFYLPFLFLCFSCQNDSTATTTAETAAETANTPPAPPKYVNAPGLNDPKKAIENGIWVIEGYVVAGDDNGQKDNVNRWYNFNADGTYERGRYGEKRGNGTWNYDETEQLLTMEDTEGAFNSQFKARVTPNGKSIIIIGTNRYNQRRIQGKLVNAADYPKQ